MPLKIENSATTTHITLADSIGIRGKMLFSLEALLYLCGAITMLISTVTALANGVIGLSVFTLAATVVFCIAFWRYVARVTIHEFLVLSPGTLEITTIRNRRKVVSAYRIDLITALHFTGFQKAADHPLKTHGFDYMGFQTQQQVINAATDEGNIAFEYEGKTVRFGLGIPSWDAEILNKSFKNMTGGKLQIDGLPEEIPEDVWNENTADREDPV